MRVTYAVKFQETGEYFSGYWQDKLLAIANTDDLGDACLWATHQEAQMQASCLTAQGFPGYVVVRIDN